MIFQGVHVSPVTMMTFHDLSKVFVLSQCYIIIHRHLVNCLCYPSHDTATLRPTSSRRALHHDIAVHPKSHSLLVQPVGLTVVEMYSVGKIYIRTPSAKKPDFASTRI